MGARSGGSIPELISYGGPVWLLANYRMKLTRLGQCGFSGIDIRFCQGWLAETRLGLQLMRGR
jgi:hypothetical protein